LKTRLATAVAAALFIVPASAQASTVSLSLGGDELPPMIDYTAANGEANKLDVKVTNATAEVSDPGAGSITAGANCMSQNPKKVVCTHPQGQKIFEVNADLLDGNDTFAAAGAQSIVDGGPGNDTLDGGELHDFLLGGGGTDDLRGNAGPDTFRDGDSTGAVNKDTINGGADVDVVDYGNRTAPVVIDLASPQANQGEAGENDSLTGIENAGGGSANDTIAGDDAVNIIGGAGGNDNVSGRGGNDRVSGGAGNDTLSGGPGRDDIEAGDGDDTLNLLNPPGEYDRLLTCDDGKDTIVGIAAAPSVESGCETGDFGFGFVMGLKPKNVGTKDVTVKIPCPAPYKKDGACKGSIVVEPKGAYARSAATRKAQRYGVAKFAITKSSAKVKIKLNSAGQKQLKKPAFKLQFTINLKETATGTKRRFEYTSYLVRSFL
jgi:RTX calcium-binding nonapeptide repeat (4 copies)